MNSKGKKQAGVLQTIIDSEIAAGLKRLGIRSHDQLRAESDLYPWVRDNPDFYAILPPGAGARARAVELLEFLAVDGLTEAHIRDLDPAITELREMLRTAAARPLQVTAAKAAKLLRDAVEGAAA
jgi:hypothetical protein